MSNHLKVISLGVALLALLAVGSISGHGVFAQDSTVTPSATTDDGATVDKEAKEDDLDRPRDGGPGKREGRLGRDGGMHKGGFGGLRIDSEALATFLGATVDELRAELRSGSSLAAVAEAHGKTRDELKTFLIEQYTAGLDAIIDATPGLRTDADDESLSTPEADATPAALTGVLA